MKIQGVGTDIIEIDRVKKVFEKWGKQFEEKILTSSEKQIKKSPSQKLTFLAGRFAAKEAVFKSLEIGPYWHKVSILQGKNGEPLVKLSPEILKNTRKKVKKVLVSISHCKKYALAQAIAIG
ncbi:holo-ACP synthase [Candidatus Aerophobetes bacterium]|uniref:Holo-[acyl-carrier-protein] synthase n=1 Tax=Aerophobetes bacterium TaxID=2030807 RepID=A0A7V5LY83_UNCAE|nr:holo-ACP synthase [Candidatus Aerophobetes bacterium]HHF97887.1 holo-[acyl-carrier-protein] synthase [Candidatus Aerophobetes bacterium]